MKVSKLILTALSLTSVAALVGACGPFDSYDDFVKIEATLTTPSGAAIANVNADQFLLSFHMTDGVDILRKVAYTDMLGYTGSMTTDANGKISLLHPNVGLDALLEVRRCENICVDRNDDTGVCVRTTTLCRDELELYTYALKEISTSKVQMQFRYGSNDVIITGTPVTPHRIVKVATEGNSHNFKRTWLMEDNFTTALFGAASNGQPVTAVVGAVQEIAEADLTPAQKATAEAAIAKIIAAGKARAEAGASDEAAAE